MTRGVRRAKKFLTRLLDRVSEHATPQVSATSLALFGLFHAGAFAFFPQRYQHQPADTTVF
jgi:hypothetical protein